MLRGEEGKKDKLCQELNLLVQQSAHAQLERLEQLTHRMETLNRGFIQSSTGSQRVSQEAPAPEDRHNEAETLNEQCPEGNQFFALEMALVVSCRFLRANLQGAQAQEGNKHKDSLPLPYYRQANPILDRLNSTQDKLSISSLLQAAMKIYRLLSWQRSP